MRKIKERILKHPETTCKGLVALTLVGLYFFKVIDTEQFGTVTVFLASIGWILSKDSGTKS